MLKLSPSDFAFLYEECKLCYWLKVKQGIFQPSMPMPGVFSAINTRIQSTLVGKDLRSLSKTLPEGKVVIQEGWVESIAVPGTDVYFKGKYDMLAKDSNGDYVLIDLKISQPADDKVEKYKTQLAAYKFALENPRAGKGIPISKMGLLIVYPEGVSFKDDKVILEFPPKWMEVPYDGKGFFGFIGEIDKLLAGPAPDESKSCKWCMYRHLGEELSHRGAQEEIPF
jgi:hypothetical protein